MKHIELEIPVEDMDEADLRATFAEVLEAHDKNVAEYAALEEQVEELEAQTEEVEGLEAEIAEFRAYFAQKGEDVTGIDSDVLAERFEAGELVEFAQKYDDSIAEVVEEADEDAEFAEEDEDEEEAEASIFAERPSKTGDLSSAVEDRKEAAKERLQGLGGIALD